MFHQSVAKKSPIWLTIRSYGLCQLLLPSSNVWVSWTRLKTQLLRSNVVSSKASSSCFMEQISCLTKLDLWTSLIGKMLKLLDLDFSLVDEQATNTLERSNAYISQVWDSKPAFGEIISTRLRDPGSGNGKFEQEPSNVARSYGFACQDPLSLHMRK